MGKRYWAIVIKRSLLGSVVIFLAGILFDSLVNEPEYQSPFLAGCAAIAIYILVITILGLLNLITGALYLWIFADKDMTESFLDDFRNAKLRGPRNYEPKTHEYLMSIADDDETAIDQRIRAATLLGSYRAAMSNGLFRSLAVTRALDNAVLRYSQEAPEN